MTKPLSPSVVQALDAARFQGSALSLPGQLDKATYAAVNKVIEAAGGKWSRKAGAHLFPGEARAAIDMATKPGFVAQKQALGQFDSPPAVVARIMELAALVRGMSVLEPSAGVGALAAAAALAGADVSCVELDPDRAAILRTAGFRTIERDFLALSHLGPFDRVLMNPPFAGQADLDHVMHAASMLKLGGLLVAVISAGAGFRQDKRTTAFRTWLAELGGTIEDLPEGAFKAAGTSVRSCIVTVRGAPRS